MDPGATAEAALVRQIREELNLSVEAMTSFGSAANTYVYGQVTYRTLDLAFRCGVSDFKPLQAMDDVEGVLFMRPGELPAERFAFDSIRRFVALFGNR